MLCDYVMSALRGDQARTARCLRRGSAARRDQELPPARVCRAPISGTIALLNIHLQICTTSGEWFGSQISDSNTVSLEWKCCPIGFWSRFQPKNLSIDWDREQLLYLAIPCICACCKAKALFSLGNLNTHWRRLVLRSSASDYDEAGCIALQNVRAQLHHLAASLSFRGNKVSAETIGQQ